MVSVDTKIRHLENRHDVNFFPWAVRFGWNLADWCRMTCRLRRYGRNQKPEVEFEYKDVCFSKPEIVISQLWIELGLQLYEIWFANRHGLCQESDITHTHNFIHLLKRQHNYTTKNKTENLTNQQHKILKRYLAQSAQWRHIMFSEAETGSKIAPQWPPSWKFDTQQYTWNSTTVTWPNMKFLKFKMADTRHVENLVLAITPPIARRFQ